ncbi:MAG: glycosyltransferase family 39 protein [Planctomycetes bacterium]|nr:glycosyltransferase family 39 protein [Planctomycetota bacterium]
MVLGLALALRIIAAFVATDLYVGDEYAYVTAGRNLATGQSSLLPFYPPLYSCFLAIIFNVFGPGLLAPRLVQALLGTAVTFLVYLIGKHIHGKREGLLAAFLFAVFPEAIGFCAMFYSENLFLLLLTVGILAVMKSFTRDSSSWLLLAAGICFGLATLTREILVFFTLLASAFVWTNGPMFRFARVQRTLLFIVPLLLLVGGYMTSNYYRFGHFVLSANHWKPLFDGNHDPHDAPIHINLWQRDIFAGERFAREKAFEEICKAQPLWIFRKTAASLTGMWTPKSFLYRQLIFNKASSGKIIILAWISTPLLALIVFGGILGFGAARSGPSRWFLLSLLSYLLLVHIVTLGLTRYRLPFLPILAVYSSYFCLALLNGRHRLCRLARPPRLFATCTFLVGLLCIWTAVFLRPRLDVEINPSTISSPDYGTQRR